MTPCMNATGGKKERYPSARSARRAFCHKRGFRNRRLPPVYHCPDCHGWHAGHNTALAV
jgi:hypothetical protein